MSEASEVVVITGASAGVGRATARKFGRARARVALLARGRDGLEAARREIEELGGQAAVIAADVASAWFCSPTAPQTNGRPGKNLARRTRADENVGSLPGGRQFRDPSADSIHRKIVCPRARHTHIWLTAGRPAGFLRWKGAIVLPNDPMIRVDLVSDSVGGPAEPVKRSSESTYTGSQIPGLASSIM
jgi:NAD(P)-dependent dehydrogenase (short-subunit alcohol dehydrogenase family)